jgi:hypothetical protein
MGIFAGGRKGSNEGGGPGAAVRCEGESNGRADAAGKADMAGEYMSDPVCFVVSINRCVCSPRALSAALGGRGDGDRDAVLCVGDPLSGTDTCPFFFRELLATEEWP